MTHSGAVVEHLSATSSQRDPDLPVSTVELTKDAGRTVVTGAGLLDEPRWHWPSR